MQPVLNVEDIKRVENNLNRAGISVSELMHRAGAAAAAEVTHMEDVSSVLIFVGMGNNGGDGWVAAENLLKMGFDVTVVCPVAPEALRSDLALVAARSAVAAGVLVKIAPPRAELDELLFGHDVCLDAMLGTGFHGVPSAPFDIWIDAINMSGIPVVSVDVPSGLSAQTGHAAGACVYADVTVTMLALKPGLLADEGRDACGAIVIAPLDDKTEKFVLEADPVAWRAETSDYLDIISNPTSAVDKYTRGSVLVVAGSTRYPGAAILAARAAARSGAGYVTLAVPACIAAIVQAQLIEIPVVPCPFDPESGSFSEDAVDIIVKLASRANAVLVGPGMRVTAATVSLCSGLLSAKTPLVMDADALNCLARLTENRLDNFPELIRRQSTLVLTPHRRELGRLMGLPDTPPDSLTSALEASRRIVWSDGGSELTIVAKGSATACVGVESAVLPKPGPASLATAGSGDVLGGVIAAQLAHNKPEGTHLPLLCAFACEVHGTASVMAEARYGSRGVMASDLIDSLGLAIDQLESQAAMPQGMDFNRDEQAAAKGDDQIA
ncbi:bifunctional ADP-dependent NAD(P)H-hydrate dehydratase/NAD(P)H-hydrate epimerase [Atopobium fossor]|uniref:bifunctional ADP-dependent NAD(P)H-hydrate dehydratase/NAD(P)H-hydrate epimerase n=1 Tax=Atopobium fossor TaxID=39487 RepID=UPI00042456B7|nr:bifunctional ADP-dependent NAD(P)H-hydrate dehydratase/NAD(P)H-hydrate epimerase [Atopobium fossor]